MEMLGKTCQELDKMTLAEIAVACTDPDPKKSGESYGDDDVMAYAMWWNSLTPEQKLYAEAD